jgi:hypothetical protein
VSAGVADTAVVAVSAGAADSAEASASAFDSAAVEMVMAPPVPGVQKTFALGRKTVLGPFRGGAVVEGVEAKGCANDTRLATADLPGQGISRSI